MKKPDAAAMQSELSASAFFKQQEPSVGPTPPFQPAAEPTADTRPGSSGQQAPPSQADEAHGRSASHPTVEERFNETPNVRMNEPLIERSNVRHRIRHSFDIYSDQLLSLKEIAVGREAVFGERVLLGDLVQEALDMFITKERNNE